MQWRSLSLGVAVSASLVASARAEPAEPRALTLPEAIAYARTHQPLLRAARARLRAIEIDGAITRARWQPTFVATAQMFAGTTNNTTGSYVAVPGFDNPRVSATRAESPSSALWAPSPSSLAGIGARQEVYDFGRLTAAAAADDLRADAERQSFEATQITLDYDVVEAYVAVCATKGVLEATRRAIERATVHRDEAKAGVSAGLRRPIELTRAEADLYDFSFVKSGPAGRSRSRSPSLPRPWAQWTRCSTPSAIRHRSQTSGRSTACGRSPSDTRGFARRLLRCGHRNSGREPLPQRCGHTCC